MYDLRNGDVSLNLNVWETYTRRPKLKNAPINNDTKPQYKSLPHASEVVFYLSMGAWECHARRRGIPWKETQINMGMKT
ncbi:hypothetical protein E2C01_023893 [Portunus trituberculatus]|uniref:Uncharacterized protein n=1 Tax=Portunus trituberculatus TaxID=210409 RepID=A0A5B7EBS1_PORTR|nr:hypothetical protein [Portunus trituberculatus]